MYSVNFNEKSSPPRRQAMSCLLRDGAALVHFGSQAFISAHNQSSVFSPRLLPRLLELSATLKTNK
jgi:hypothetical protein